MSEPSSTSIFVDPRFGGPIGTLLAERHLWSYLPRPAVSAPDGVARVALSFDLDYQADTDALKPLVDLLLEEQASATFFSIGALVQADPAPYRYAAENGFELANHTQNHPDNPVLCPDREFWSLSVDEMIAEIGVCQDSIEAATGQRPTGFRSPHFKDAPRIRQALAAFPEIDWMSTTLASRSPARTPFFPDTRDAAGRLSLNFPARSAATASGFAMIPLSTCPQVRWSPFCSYTSIRRPANPTHGAGIHTVSQWQSLWSQLLKRDRDIGFVSVYFDPIDVMRDDETQTAFRLMLREAKREGWSLDTLAAVHAAWKPALSRQLLS